MSKTNLGWEPASNRPHKVALSHAEIIALINYHVAQTKRCTKFVGKNLLVLQANSILPKRRESNALIEKGRKICNAHIGRAEGLQSILAAKIENSKS